MLLDAPPWKRLSVPMEHFSTGRLTAERLREDHLADLVALHRDAEVSRYLGGVRPAETTRIYLGANMEHWDQHGFGLWVLRTKDGAFAGRAGIRHILVDDIDEIEIAYAFKREFWGRGLASETAIALTDIGLLHHELPSLIGLVYVGNGASCRVLEKSNYLLERSTIRHGEDVVIYRIRR
ncbi:RimJ/RimL family protein N-acetyltransferase [Bradyrhizobium sp. LM6.10]